MSRDASAKSVSPRVGIPRRRALVALLISSIGIGSLAVGVAGAGSDPYEEENRARDGNQMGGFFRVKCEPSHFKRDDPIVFPGKKGASHLHQFFGNRSTNAMTTEGSLRRAGTTCRNLGDRSAYWVPTLFENGRRVRFKGVTVYYKAGQPAERIVAIPAGLKMLAGNPQAKAYQPFTKWSCGPSKEGGYWKEDRWCPNADLRLSIQFPECWDGRNLDSRDHMSHVIHAASYINTQRTRDCPQSHPVPIPRVYMVITYDSRGSNGMALSSGGRFSAHGDFFNGWDPKKQQELIDRCLKANRRC